MAERLRIMFVDDQPDVAKNAADQLPTHVHEVADVEVLSLDEVKIEIGIVFRRYRMFLDKKSFADVQADLPCRFDHVDVLVLDYDLKNTSNGGEWASGLEVARTARAFTTVRTLILLNQFRSRSRFDLTMIEGTTSLADVDVPREQLANPGLWQACEFEGFRPWEWPNLLTEARRFEELRAWIAQNLDRPVLDALSLNAGLKEADQPAQTMPREMWAIAMSDPSWTFRQMIEKAGFVPPQEAERLMKDEDAAPRAAAAVFAHWFERHVVSAQEIFVDAAHLAFLAPWLLSDPQSEELRKKTCSLGADAIGAFVDEVAKHQLQPDIFSSRPLFRYKEIQSAAELSRPSGFSFSAVPDVVFCEDLSAFVERKVARPFPSLLPGTYSIRFVCDQGQVAGKFSEVQDPRRVDYAPQSLFAL